MSTPVRAPTDHAPPVFVPAETDRFGRFKVLGISSIAFKVSRQESTDVFVVEITLQKKGGPAKHVHFDQDEWFYAVEGDLLIEVGDDRFRMKPGDSLWAKRGIPHTWANVGEGRMRFAALVTPAGRLEEFFENAAKAGGLPGPDQSLWRPYGMEWVGPPIKID